MIAKKSLELYKDIEFLFVFKPECYNDKYQKISSERIKILKTTENFKMLLSAADIFFSFQNNKNSTLPPPLTWIEAMGMGIPILTTYAKGVEEIIEDMKNGFISPDIPGLIEKIRHIKEMDLSFISQNAIQTIFNKFNLDYITEQYFNSWEEVISE